MIICTNIMSFHGVKFSNVMFSNFHGSNIHDYDFQIMIFQGASFIFLMVTIHFS